MALGKAAVAGAVAALALPYVMRDDHDAFGGWIHRGTINFDLGGVHLAWSWPIFCVVTLFAWGLLAWANK